MRISGGAVGSALLMRSEPRLSGRNWHTDAENPENECSFSPILSVEKGRKWIWISGVASRGLVLKNAPDVPAAIVSGPLRNAAYRAPANIRRTVMVDDVVERDLFRAAHHHSDLHVILQILPYPGCIEHDIDAVPAQQFRRADA